MRDYQVEQFNPRTACSSKNCAASSAAIAIFFGTRGAAEMTAEQVRRQSRTSCIPHEDTPSGGITIGDVERVGAAHGVEIDYGRAATSFYRRWTPTEIKARLSTFYGGVIQGLYSAMDAPWRAHGSTFQGGHSGFAHDLRSDLPDSHYDKVQDTVCWHDPLRPRPIRIPIAALLKYNQAAGLTKGFVGWVKIPAIPGGTYAKPMTDRTRVRYAKGAALHHDRTTGKGSTVRIIKPKGKLVEIAMYADGEPYGSGPNRTRWGALSLLGDLWVHLNRLTNVGGPT